VEDARRSPTAAASAATLIALIGLIALGRSGFGGRDGAHFELARSQRL
jgi:hypothetical protein